MPNTEDLINQLKSETKLTQLNESFNFTYIKEKINSNVVKKALDSLYLSTFKLSENELEIIHKVKNMYVDPSWRILTYPNIHNDGKYKLETSFLFKYVMNEIKKNSKNEEVSFNSSQVIEEGISKCLKELTGNTPGKRVTLDEFKYNYQLKVFGSYKKVLVSPRLYALLTLTEKTPITISYIDNNLIIDQINNMNKYTKLIEDDFKRMIKNNPKIEKRCNVYLNCINRAIDTELSIYKIIRNTLIQLHHEYMYILREIVRLNNINNESSNYNDIDKNYHEIQSLNESFIESNSDYLWNIYTNNFDTMYNELQSELNYIKNSICLASNLNRDFCVNCKNLPIGLFRFNDIDTSNYQFQSSDIDDINDIFIKNKNIILGDLINKNINIDDINIMTDTVLKSINKMQSLLDLIKTFKLDQYENDNIKKQKILKCIVISRILDDYKFICKYFVDYILRQK